MIVDYSIGEYCADNCFLAYQFIEAVRLMPTCWFHVSSEEERNQGGQYYYEADAELSVDGVEINVC